MRRNIVYAFVFLMLIWIILMESVSWITLVSGAFISVVCLWFSLKFMPLKKISDVYFTKLFLYPFYLIGQIYIQGFLVIKMILTGVRVDIVEVHTKLKSDFLRAIFISSVTLTPGSVPLELNGEVVTVLNLNSKKDGDACKVAEAQRARLEKRLIKAQK